MLTPSGNVVEFARMPNAWLMSCPSWEGCWRRVLNVSMIVSFMEAWVGPGVGGVRFPMPGWVAENGVS